jgi:hypothetical protein
MITGSVTTSDGVRSAHGEGVLTSHGLSGEVAQGQIDRFSLGPQAERTRASAVICSQWT